MFRLLPLAAILFAGVAAGAEPPPVSFYDKDPQHLWNRLYATLATHAADGRSAPPDLLDPPSPDALFEGPLNREAVAILGEFVKGSPGPDAMTPVQRAIMERDLLAVFHRITQRERLDGPSWTGPARELATALVRAIRQVALTTEEIRKLPDNYAVAAGMPGAVTAYDAAHPGPFLPKDLLDDGGPWIALEAPGQRSTMVAGFHFKMFRGRSSFEVRMRHPDGRAAGEAYLKALAGMPQPWVFEKPARGNELRPNGPDIGTWPNPATPQFPAGTMWALIRRAVLADADGRPVVSPVVESVQIRVYRALSAEDAMKSPEFSNIAKALEDGKRAGEVEGLVAAVYQTSFEWEMRRGLLVGKGGFHLTQPDDLRFSGFAASEPRPISGFCLQCHFAPGIHSIQSRARLFGEALVRPPEFKPANRELLDLTTVYEVSTLPGWVLLQWMW